MRARARTGAVALTMALAGAACGGGSGGGESTSGTVDQNIKSGVQEQLLSSTTATSAAVAAKKPTSIEEWEALWATERAGIVKKIKDNKWGLQPDGKTIKGPEGFTIDTSKCSAGWNNVEGLTDTEIKIANHAPYSGTLADAGNIPKGAGAIWKYYSDKGVFKDANGKTRKINLVTRDDGYDPTRTIPMVDEFLDSEKGFAIWGLGSANVLKTYDKINQRCVPHPFAVTGHPAWGDPVNHPWTTGILFAYNTEAVLWGSFLDKHFDELKGPDGKVTVAALIMNNDFGKAYDGGFKNYLSTSPNKANINYVSEVFEPQAPTIKDAMTSLAAKKPAMYISMMAGTPCTQSIVEVAENGMKEKVKYLWQPSVCKPASQVGKAVVGGDGSASNGWWIMGGGFIDFNADANSENIAIKWGRQILKDNGFDYKASGNLGSGITYGWAWSQALIIAGQLDGGLTRANFITALRSMEMTNPWYQDGIKFNLNGGKDAYWIEGSDISKYDSAQQTWVKQGDLIELSGKSANCAWDQSIANCK